MKGEDRSDQPQIAVRGGAKNIAGRQRKNGYPFNTRTRYFSGTEKGQTVGGTEDTTQ